MYRQSRPDSVTPSQNRRWPVFRFTEAETETEIETETNYDSDIL